ncbi:NAD dehydrogenase [Hymenopellis radicata]|nr:NAD dehydrogenase [Hymenopellis radicata]
MPAAEMMPGAVRGLKAALNSTGKYKYKAPEFSIDHVVVGGGVVGLAIARQLCHRFPSKTTYLIERHSRPGEETSSRNSEVIHSGLYYPADSLKTRFCLRGRQLLYKYCQSSGVDHRKTGKLVVAHASQQSYIENLYAKSLTLTPPPNFEAGTAVLPTELISGDAARSMEPNLSGAITGALWSPETGIIDSHALMESFEKDISDIGGELVYSTDIVRIDPSEQSSGCVVQMLTGGGASVSDAVHARTLINAAGLSAPYLLNAILPAEQQIPMYFARGSYASYSGPGIAGISHLIYPCPEQTSHAFQGLGTHLTLDLQGKVRFGPDVEWVSPQDDSDDVTFWKKHLIPDSSRLEEMHQAVTRYLPGVSLEGMATDYVGIRPKIAPPGSPFQDFVIRRDANGSMISLLAIESPGLTSCMAIAEYVVEEME